MILRSVSPCVWRGVVCALVRGGRVSVLGSMSLHGSGGYAHGMKSQIRHAFAL